MSVAPRRDDAASTDVDARSVRGVQYLVSLQLATRVATFCLNTAVLRIVDPSVFGLAAQLQVITNLVLFVSRESVRRTVARSTDADTVLLPWLAAFPLGVLSALIVGALWLWGGTAEEWAVPGFREAVLLTLVANFVELLGEPAYVRGAKNLDFRQRFIVESGSVVAMCVALFASVYFGGLGVLGWAVGQLAFAVVSTVGVSGCTLVDLSFCSQSVTQYHWTCPGPFRDRLPRRWTSFSPSTVALWAAFQWQAVQTLLLQEGEKILLKMTSTLVDQGLYAVVANLGSLVVRIVFLPLEDVAYAYFARLLAVPSSSGRARDVLRVLLRLLATMGAFVLALGPPLSFFVLDLLVFKRLRRTQYGARMSATAAPDILRAYCLYIALLALNGVSEAFVRAAITPAQQASLNGWLVAISAVQVGSSIVMLRQHASAGLVYASCIGMALRLAYSLRFVQSHFVPAAFELRTIIPSRALMAYLLLARVLLSLDWFHCGAGGATRLYGGLAPSLACLLHGGAGAVLFVGAVAVVYRFDRDWLRDVQRIWRGRKGD